MSYQWCMLAYAQGCSRVVSRKNLKKNLGLAPNRSCALAGLHCMPREFCCLLLQPGNDVATVGTPIKSTQDKSIRDLRAVKSASFSRLY